MTARRGRSAGAIGVAGIAMAVMGLGGLAGHGTAAADPPGFPSTGSAAGPTAGAGPATLDDVARARIAALRKFARDKESDPKFKEHEAADRACRIDHDKKIVTLTFNADGVMHCKLSELAEGYQLEIYVLTVKDVYSTGSHYRVTVTPGTPLKSVPIQGTSSDVKTMIEMLRGAHAEYTDADWWRAPTLYGPYHFETGTVKVTLDEAAVAEETKLSIAPLYSLDLALLGVVGPGLPSYAIVNGMISRSLNRTDLDYYLGVHLYPFSWNRNGNKGLRPGRYFSDDYTQWNDRLSLIAGINLSRATEGGYLGLGIELYSGISVTGGWQPRKYRQLQSGHAVGDMIMATEAPTDAAWKLSGWGVGLSVDATLLRPLLSLIAK